MIWFWIIIALVYMAIALFIWRKDVAEGKEHQAAVRSWLQWLDRHRSID